METFNIEENEQVIKIIISNDVLIQNINELKDIFNDLRTKEKNIEIEIKDGITCDFSFYQLLISLISSVKIKISAISGSDAFLKNAAIMGFDRLNPENSLNKKVKNIFRRTYE